MQGGTPGGRKRRWSGWQTLHISDPKLTLYLFVWWGEMCSCGFVDLWSWENVDLAIWELVFEYKFYLKMISSHLALLFATTGITFFLNKKSNQKSQVPLNRSAYRNTHAFWHSNVSLDWCNFFLDIDWKIKSDNLV
jgi:hypothetical protein